MSVSKLEFKDSAYLDTAFPASERIYMQGRIHPSVRVPLREILLKDDSRQRVYDTRGPWGDPRQVCNPRNSQRLLKVGLFPEIRAFPARSPPHAITTSLPASALLIRRALATV